VLDPVALREVRERGLPEPWAEGTRTLTLRIPWTDLSGRRVGARPGTAARPNQGIA
jgi:hypothetical protein